MQTRLTNRPVLSIETATTTKTFRTSVQLPPRMVASSVKLTLGQENIDLVMTELVIMNFRETVKLETEGRTVPWVVQEATTPKCDRFPVLVARTQLLERAEITTPCTLST